MVAGWRFVMRSPWEDSLAERETTTTWQRALPFCRLYPRSGVMWSGARLVRNCTKMGADALYMDMVIGVESFGYGRRRNRGLEIRHAITWEGNVLADRAGTNRVRIRAHSVQNVGAGRARTSRGPA
jgi:hypothetical protein